MGQGQREAPYRRRVQTAATTADRRSGGYGLAGLAGAAGVTGAGLETGIDVEADAGFTGAAAGAAGKAELVGAAFVGAGVAGATGCVSSCKRGEACLLISAELE